MSAFLLLILRQQTEERGAFWVVLQVSLASADTCCERHTARFSEDVPLGGGGGEGARWWCLGEDWDDKMLFLFLFFPFLLFALDLSALISPLLSHRQQKYAGGERLSGRKNTSKHCEALWSHFCSKQLPFLATIPGFEHRKGEWGGVGGLFLQQW